MPVGNVFASQAYAHGIGMELPCPDASANKDQCSDEPRARQHSAAALGHDPTMVSHCSLQALHRANDMVDRGCHAPARARAHSPCLMGLAGGGLTAPRCFFGGLAGASSDSSGSTGASRRCFFAGLGPAESKCESVLD